MHCDFSWWLLLSSSDHKSLDAFNGADSHFLSKYSSQGIEYESQICDVVLPTLNARCIVLSDLLQNTPHTFTIKTYHLKISAMLFSSFESLLFLDADNFPATPAEELFDIEPWTTYQLIIWPEYWTSTASPYFNTITGLEPSVLRTRLTIEAGQILVSKRHHAKTLLLAAYYNVYSDHFYTMLAQGGPGEGDKGRTSFEHHILHRRHTTCKSWCPLSWWLRNSSIRSFHFVQLPRITEQTRARKDHSSFTLLAT